MPNIIRGIGYAGPRFYQDHISIHGDAGVKSIVRAHRHTSTGRSRVRLGQRTGRNGPTGIVEGDINVYGLAVVIHAIDAFHEKRSHHYRAGTPGSRDVLSAMHDGICVAERRLNWEALQRYISQANAGQINRRTRPGLEQVIASGNLR